MVSEVFGYLQEIPKIVQVYFKEHFQNLLIRRIFKVAWCVSKASAKAFKVHIRDWIVMKSFKTDTTTALGIGITSFTVGGKHLDLKVRSLQDSNLLLAN